MVQKCIEKRTVSVAAAQIATEAAIAHAKENGYSISVAVVDHGARLIAFLRDDGTFFPSGDIAIDKAKTAAGFGVASGDLYEVVKGGDAVLRGLTSRPGAALFGGGVPIFLDGFVIGAIGVSGGTEDQDVECAKAGAAAVVAWK